MFITQQVNVNRFPSCRTLTIKVSSTYLRMRLFSKAFAFKIFKKRRRHTWPDCFLNRTLLPPTCHQTVGLNYSKNRRKIHYQKSRLGSCALKMLGQIIKQWQLCPLLLCEPGKKTAKGQAGHVLKAFHSNTVQSHQLKIIRPFWRLGFFCHGYNYRFSTELGNLLLNKRRVNRFYKISQSCSAQTLRILLWSCQALDFSWCGIGGKHTRLNNDTKTRTDGAIVQCSKNTIMYVYKIPLINETQIKHLHGFCKLHLVPIIPHLFFSLFSPINGLVKGLLLNSNEN